MLRMSVPDVGGPLRWMLGLVASVLRPAPETVSVMIVADHPVFAEALALAVDGTTALSCVGVAVGTEQAQRLAARVGPEVAMVDLAPDDEGFATVRALLECRPALRVLLLTERNPSAALMQAAVEAGVLAVFPKTTSLGVVVSAIPSLSECLFTTDRKTIRRVCETVEAPSPSPKTSNEASADSPDAGNHDPGSESGVARLNGKHHAANLLTRRERDILSLLDRGIDVPSASDRLGISVNTTRGYVKNLYRKLDVHSQVELLAVARDKGLLDEDAD